VTKGYGTKPKKRGNSRGSPAKAPLAEGPIAGKKIPSTLKKSLESNHAGEKKSLS